MKKLAILFLLAVVFIAYYLFCNRFQETEIEDVGRSQTLALIAKNKMVYGLEANVEGYLDDTAKIGNLIIGKGDVKANLYSGDCYVDTFRINY